MTQELFHVSIYVKTTREEIARVGYDEVLRRLQRTTEDALNESLKSSDDIYQLTDGISIEDESKSFGTKQQVKLD